MPRGTEFLASSMPAVTFLLLELVWTATVLQETVGWVRFEENRGGQEHTNLAKYEGTTDDGD